MKAIPLVVLCLTFLCACHDQRTEADAVCHNIVLSPHNCQNFGGVGLACAYKFDELLAFSRCPRVSPYSAIVVIPGVLKRKGSSYYFYRDLRSADSGDPIAIKITAIHDEAITDPRIREKLVGGKVIVLGYYDPMGGVLGSLDLDSVRWYTGTWAMPQPVIR